MRTLRPDDDQQRIQRLRKGAGEAFTEIYRAYHDVLYIYAFRVLEDEDLAEDTVHEVFLSLWERRLHIQPSIALRPYLFQAVRFTCIKLIQRHRVRVNTTRYLQQYLDSYTDDVADRLEEQELMQQLRAAVDRLPGKMSQVFWMRQDNYSDEEIAAQLGISVKTVKNIMSQTLGKLKARFKTFIFSLFA